MTSGMILNMAFDAQMLVISNIVIVQQSSVCFQSVEAISII